MATWFITTRVGGSISRIYTYRSVIEVYCHVMWHVRDEVPLIAAVFVTVGLVSHWWMCRNVNYIMGNTYLQQCKHKASVEYWYLSFVISPSISDVYAWCYATFPYSRCTMLSQPGTNWDLYAFSVSCTADKLVQDTGLMFSGHCSISLHGHHVWAVIYYKVSNLA